MVLFHEGNIGCSHCHKRIDVVTQGHTIIYMHNGTVRYTHLGTCTGRYTQDFWGDIEKTHPIERGRADHFNFRVDRGW